MTGLSPDIINSVAMTAHAEDNKNNPEQSESKTDGSMKSCLMDVPFKIVRPLVISMSLFGLLHLSGKERRWAPITKIYSTVVLLFLWAVVIKLFTLYGSDGLGQALAVKILLHSWAFLCASAATSMYMACRKQNKFGEFLTRWSKLLKMYHGSCQGFDEVNTSRYVRKANRSSYFCLIISWLGMVVACCSIGYSSFLTNSLDFFIYPMDPNHPHALLVKCLLYVVSVYMCAAWVFPLCLFYNIGSVIYEEFRIFHVDFEKIIRGSAAIVCIGTYRRRHQEICLLVENADDILSGFSAISIVMCTVNGMLNLYSMIWYSDLNTGVVSFLFSMFWLLSVLVYLGIIAVGGGNLNHMAHQPLKTIHNIQPNTISPEVSLQITMFLNKLTGESIGLTAMGMFVIDKPTILTIAGAFLTYFVVLVQFKQPSDTHDVFENCTSFIGH